MAKIKEDRFVEKSSTMFLNNVVEHFRDPLCRCIINPFYTEKPPVVCRKCEVIYCSECLPKLSQNKGLCISCNAKFLSAPIPKTLISIFEKYVFFCRYKHLGCKAIYMLRQEVDHLKECPAIVKPKPELKLEPKPEPEPKKFQVETQKTEVKKEEEAIIPPEEEKVDADAPEGRVPIYECASFHVLMRIYDVVGNFRDNSYYCEMCGQNSTRPIEEGVLHCNICNYDICHPCSVNFQCEDEKEMKCIKGHVMFKTLDILAITNSPYYYQDNIYYCHACKKSWDCTKQGAFHCDMCNYDVCSTCFVTNMNSFRHN